MGAVRTAGRGSEVEASAFLLSARRSQGSPATLCSPPDVERTLTVGREAILEDSLEDVLTRPMSGTSLWIAKIRFASTCSLTPNIAKQIEDTCEKVRNQTLDAQLWC